MGCGFLMKKAWYPKMNVKLYVGNLPKSMTQQQLATLFSQAGDVILADLITDRNNGASKGFAFVTMSTKGEAERAIHMFNAYSLSEQPLKVDMAQPSFQL